MFKRTICMLLVLISVFGLIPVQAMAETESSIAADLADTLANNPLSANAVAPVSVDGVQKVVGATADEPQEAVPSEVDYMPFTPSKVMPAELGDTQLNEAEYNDSIEYANTIKDDYTVFGALTKEAGDVDVFKFTISGKRQVDLLFINYADDTLRFGVYNSSGKLVKMCTYNGTQQDSNGDNYHVHSLQFLSLSKGTYYIQVWDNTWFNYSYMFYYNSTPITPKITSAENTSSGIKIKWNASPGAKNYRVYRRTYGSTEISVLNNTVSTYFTDTTAVKGRTYVYYVRSWDTNTNYLSDLVTNKGYTFTRLGVPKISSLTNTSKGIQIKWAKVTGATGYKIYRQKKGASSWTLIKTISKGSTVSYTDTSSKLSNGTAYRYRVRATYKNSNIYGDKLIYSYGSIKTTARLSTKGINTLVADGPNSCLVYWNRNASASGYQVRITRNGDTIKTVKIKGKDSLSAQITGMKTGKKYGVKVRSYKTISGTTYYSGWSSTKYVTCY